jgi:hypothetical protein
MALNHLGSMLAMSGEARKGRTLLEEGVDRLRRSGDGFETAMVLESLAYATLECGDRGLAAILWAESIRTSLVVGPMGNIAWCLNGFARLAAASDPSRALRLAAGAAAITNGTRGFLLGPLEEPLVESWLVGARSSLDSGAAAACWRIGEAMPLEELVSYALSEPLLAQSTASRKPE